VAIEHATLAISDYVYVSGGFAFTRQTDLDVNLTGAESPRPTPSTYSRSARAT
jgi:hypothetical protein